MADPNQSPADERYLPKERFLYGVGKAADWLGFEKEEKEKQQDLLGQIYDYDNGIEKPKEDFEIPLYLFQTAEWAKQKRKKYTKKKLYRVLEVVSVVVAGALSALGELVKYTDPVIGGAVGTAMQCSSPALPIAAVSYKRRQEAKFEHEQPLAAAATEQELDEYCNALGLCMAYKNMSLGGYKDLTREPEPAS